MLDVEATSNRRAQVARRPCVDFTYVAPCHSGRVRLTASSSYPRSVDPDHRTHSNRRLQMLRRALQGVGAQARTISDTSGWVYEVRLAMLGADRATADRMVEFADRRDAGVGPRTRCEQTGLAGARCSRSHCHCECRWSRTRVGRAPVPHGAFCSPPWPRFISARVVRRSHGMRSTARTRISREPQTTKCTNGSNERSVSGEHLLDPEAAAGES